MKKVLVIIAGLLFLFMSSSIALSEEKAAAGKTVKIGAGAQVATAPAKQGTLTQAFTRQEAPAREIPQQAPVPAAQQSIVPEAIKKSVEMQYTVGVDDVLDISVLQPEPLVTTVIVSIDGSISFPYIGNVEVRGMTLTEIRDTIQKRLSEGYMKYPVVSVSLKESRSRKFFVYGEVIRPGTYPVDDTTTVLKAISMAGGFTKYGSSSRVKVLRPFKDKPGYQTIKVNMGALMDGNPKADVNVKQGDIIVISEGIF